MAQLSRTQKSKAILGTTNKGSIELICLIWIVSYLDKFSLIIYSFFSGLSSFEYASVNQTAKYYIAGWGGSIAIAWHSITLFLTLLLTVAVTCSCKNHILIVFKLVLKSFE